jgi:hypothetical protein
VAPSVICRALRRAEARRRLAFDHGLPAEGAARPIEALSLLHELDVVEELGSYKSTEQKQRREIDRRSRAKPLSISMSLAAP